MSCFRRRIFQILRFVESDLGSNYRILALQNALRRMCRGHRLLQDTLVLQIQYDPPQMIRCDIFHIVRRNNRFLFTLEVLVQS
jgi:hypothetical protein